MVGGSVWSVKNASSMDSLHVLLPSGTFINCESDAVVSYSGNGIEVKGQLTGGLLGGLARLFLTQESFFTTQVHNRATLEQKGEVLLAPKELGGLFVHTLSGSDLLLTKGSYVASDSKVSVTSEMNQVSTRSAFSGTGMFVLRASGEGNVALAAYGSIQKYYVNAGEVRAVDNGHIVAWSAEMSYRIGFAGGGSLLSSRVMNSLKSGEGLMCFFSGPGLIYLQTHKLDNDKDFDGRRMKKKSSGFSYSIFFTLVFLVILNLIRNGMDTSEFIKHKSQKEKNASPFTTYSSNKFDGRIYRSSVYTEEEL